MPPEDVEKIYQKLEASHNAKVLADEEYSIAVHQALGNERVVHNLVVSGCLKFDWSQFRRLRARNAI